jgi:hypothetical protein
VTRNPQGRQFYGWHDPNKGFLVSREPPDAPVRPAWVFEAAADAEAYIKKTKHAKVLWFGKMPKVARADQP